MKKSKIKGERPVLGPVLPILTQFLGIKNTAPNFEKTIEKLLRKICNI